VSSSRFSKLLNKIQASRSSGEVVWLDLGSKVAKLKIGKRFLQFPSQVIISSEDETKLIKPIQQGQIYSNSDLKLFLSKKVKLEFKNKTFSQLKCVVPSSSTKVEAKIFQKNLHDLGVGKWQVSYKKNSVQDLSGVIDLGAETTEIILSSGPYKVAQTLGWGSQNLLDRVQQFLKKTYSLEVDQEAVVSLLQEIKEDGLWDSESKLTQKINLRGKDLESFTPQTKTIELSKLQPVLLEALGEAAEEVMLFLSRVETSLVAKVLSEGMVLTGELAKLHQIDQYWSEKFKAEFEYRAYVYF
jgi:actin-like ATPase involved in cell morphogenesis